MDARSENLPTTDELLQLAQSLSIDGSLGRADTLRVVEALRYLAQLVSD